jgi:hypothetical protein
MPAVNLLTKKGWTVQLSHDSAEPAGNDHGFIVIKDATGATLVECSDFQHNRQDYYMPGWEKQLAEVLSPIPNPTKEEAECASAQPEAGGA